MAVAVIDGLEAIEVDEQCGLHRAGSLDVEYLVEACQQGAPVEQPGERVAHRVVAQIVPLAGDMAFMQEELPALALARVGAKACQHIDGHHEEDFVDLH